MKSLFVTIMSLFTIFVVILSSCNSDNINEPIENSTEESEALFRLSFSIKDKSGNDILPNYTTYAGNACENIYLKMLNEKDTIIFSNIKDAMMNITISSLSNDGTNIHDIAVQLGNDLSFVIDTIKCETEKTKTNMLCKKVWYNGELVFDSKEGSDDPYFTISKTLEVKEVSQAKPIILTNSEKVFADNDFAIELFKEVCAESENTTNVFISPFSVNMALNMLANGSNGETRSQIIETIKAKGYTIEQINEYSRELREALTTVDPTTSLNIANSIWYDKNFSIKDNFIKTNKTFYDAEVSSLDLSSSDALNTINKWCSDKTNGKISQILDKMPSDETKMMLINTLYFKSLWVKDIRFNEKNTKEDNFYITDGSIEKVKMMHQMTYCPYFKDNIAAYIEMAFGNGAFSMVFALPNEEKTLNDVISNLTLDTWKSEHFTRSIVDISMPRFNANCTYEMEKSIFPNLNLLLPFSPDADFSYISDQPIYVNKLIHKTRIEVNESGCEAASISAAIMVDGGPLYPETYTLNKPFIFAIRENSTGLILFIGKIDKIDI